LPDYYGEKRYERIWDVLEKFLEVAIEVISSRVSLISCSANHRPLERTSPVLGSAKRKRDAYIETKLAEQIQRGEKNDKTGKLQVL